MKTASPPLWLIADWFAWLMLMLRFKLLHHVFLICADRAVKRRMAPGDLDLMAPLLAETEADVAWVIARRVRKLCGLSGQPERYVQRLPASQGAFIRRYRQVNLDCLEIDRRVARRVARAMRAARPLRPPSASTSPALRWRTNVRVARLPPLCRGSTPKGGRGLAAMLTSFLARAPPLLQTTKLAA